MSSIKRDVKKKTYASTGGRVRRLDLQPTVYVSAPIDSGVLLWAVRSSPGVSLPVATMPIESKRLRKRDRCLMVIMVLSEARGLSLFLIIRGGIA